MTKHNAVPPQFDTLCVHGGIKADPSTGALLTPIYQSTAYAQPSVARYLELGYSYSRSGNPTVSALESKLAEIEGAQCPAVCFTTGMAAVNALLCTFLSAGDHVICTQCSYGGTNRALRALYAKQFGIKVSFVDFSDLEAIRKAIIPGKTKMIISETPCNPTLQLADLEEITKIAKSASDPNPPEFKETLQEGDGPSRACLNGRVLHAADSTLAPPPIMKGLNFGVDILFTSLTKYYCGHNMHLGGALLTNERPLYDLMHFKQNVMGSIMTPFTAYSILQTAKTLHLRVEKQCKNALAIANFLSTHPKVNYVHYPGLRDHPQHKLANKQHSGNLHGSMVTFDVVGGTEAGRRVMDACCAPWILAENLGAVESIMTCPSVFTHGNMPREARLAVGITDGLIRLSVGIEDQNDLVEALRSALNAA